MRITSIFNQSGFTKHCGNMAEYILPAALIGITLLGGFAWCLNESSGQQSLLKLAQGDHLELGANGQTALVSKTFGKNPNGLTLRYQLKNGSFIELTNVPNNPGLSVEVDGVNGTTEQILAVLEQLIRQLEENGGDPNTISSLKQLAAKGYLLADNQKALEQAIASCGQDKQCVQQKVFGDDELRRSTLGLTFGSCAHASEPVCNRERFSNDGQEEMTPERWQAIEAIQPGFSQTVSTSPQFNFDRNNLFIGRAVGEFLDAFQQVQQSQLPSPELGQLVTYLSQSIYQLSYNSANNAATVGTIVGFNDVNNGQSLPLGSNPNIKPTEYTRLVSESVARDVPPLNTSLPNSVQTGNHSGVICAAGLGRQQDGTCR